jgi:hypothetical protein
MNKKPCNFPVTQSRTPNPKTTDSLMLKRTPIRKVESLTNQEINIMSPLKIMRTLIMSSPPFKFSSRSHRGDKPGAATIS